MALTIAVAGTDRQEEEDWIMDELADRGITAEFIDPSDVSYLVKDGDLSIRYAGEPLHDIDLLYMRRTRFDVEASRDLVAAMDARGVRTVERKGVFFNPLSKFYSLLSFVGADIDTVDIPSTAVIRQAGEAAPIAGAIGYPLIVKPLAGREGEGVQKIDDRESLAEAVASQEFPVLIQEYLDIETEYRVLVVGGEALGTVAKRGGEGVTRNFAQGAEFEPVDRPVLEDAAVDIASRMGIEVAGVDIVETADGGYHEIECNRCPQFKGFAAAHPDIDVPARIVDYLVEQAE